MTTTAGGPTAPETLAEFVLSMQAGKLVAEVIRLSDGTTRMRLSHGEGVGDVLTVAHVAAFRTMLSNCLTEMYAAERRAAA